MTWNDVPIVAWCAVLALAVNWIAFVPAAIAKTERFYDATGSASFIAVVALCVATAPDHAWPRMVPAALVLLWTLRLGAFLVARIRRTGKDGRFDAMKHKPARFLIAWTLQGLWVFVTASPMIVMVSSTERDVDVGAGDVVGWSMWIAGFAIEVVADAQKRKWSADANNKGRFIDVGLWRWSRHPNYFGEIVLWCGMFASGVGHYAGAQWLCAASPIFVAGLLRFVSGVPLLEARADARFGDDAAYQAYKQRTPLLVLRPPRRAPAAS